jgi:hypothetical protein
MKVGLVVALVVVMVLLGFLAVLWAEGSPTQPNISLYTPIQPGSAQSLLVQVQFGFYSTSVVNPIWQLGYHVTWSAVERTSASSTPTVLVTNATSAPQIVTSSNLFYTMQSTLSVVTVAACSGSGCQGVSENVTITAQANVATPFIAWFSPVTVAVFSSTTPCVPPNACAPVTAEPVGTPPVSTSTALNTFLLELAVPLTAIVALGSFAVVLMGGRHPAFIGLAIGATVAVFVEFLVW